jgi:hypothetical protein
VEYSTYPRGPRSGPGCSVPVRHHLIGPIRPTRRRTAISPHGGLYAMPSLCGSAYATREWFRAFTAHSFLACRPLRPRGLSPAGMAASLAARPIGDIPIFKIRLPQSPSRLHGSGVLMSRAGLATTASLGVSTVHGFRPRLLQPPHPPLKETTDRSHDALTGPHAAHEDDSPANGPSKNYPVRSHTRQQSPIRGDGR